MKRLLLLAALFFIGAAGAQNYPSRPIKIIVPFTPGSATDVMGRIVSERLNAAWGQPVVVENRPGAGGTIGIRETTRAEFARDFEPRTAIHDAAKFSREHPALWPEGASADGAFVITAELFGSAIPAGSEVRSRLQVGFDKEIEPGEFTFTPVAE